MKLELEEINIERFKSIDNVYNFIEKNAFELIKNYDLIDLWVKYRDYSKKESEKQKSQWEIDCFMFEIKGERLFSQIYSTVNDTNEIVKYPDLNKLQIEVIDYLKGRVKTSKNSILLARYNHLLWKLPNNVKREKFALNAIENYISSIKEYYLLFERTCDDRISSEIGELFEILIALGTEIKSSQIKIKRLTKFLLFEADNLQFYTLHNLLEVMLESKKIFKPKEFNNTLSFFDKELIKDKSKIDDFLMVNYYLSTAIKISDKLGLNSKKWQNELGFAYLRMAAEIKEEDRFWIKQDYHSKAISAFKLAGNLEYRKITEKLYADLKPQIKLPTHSITYTEEFQSSLKENQEKIKQDVENLLKESPDYIYQFISKGPFFPNYASVIKASEKKGNSFLDFVTNISFDKNKNIANEKAQNKELMKIFEIYQFHIEITALPFLYYVFFQGIKSGKLTFNNLLKFLIKNTWIGKQHIDYDLGGKEIITNWIQHLSPSIVEFYIQIQAFQSSSYYKPNFILCIDSLTLKMEGLFRNFCKRAGVPTSFSKEKGMQEAYIHNVFDNEIIIEFFNDDDRLLFNYLFSNAGGLNLRNNVAHCFYHVNEYNSDKMLLLIAALLRVGKYNIENKT